MNKVEAQLIDEAFRAILAENHSAAARALAAAQAEHYGMKPHRSGAPTHDALGRAMVFKDQGCRYTIPVLLQDGTQVRVLLGDDRYTGAFDTFEVHAPNAKAAHQCAKEYARAKGLHDLRHTSSQPSPSVWPGSGWVCVRYQHGRSLD